MYSALTSKAVHGSTCQPPNSLPMFWQYANAQSLNFANFLLVEYNYQRPLVQAGVRSCQR